MLVSTLVEPENRFIAPYQKHLKQLMVFCLLMTFMVIKVMKVMEKFGKTQDYQIVGFDGLRNAA